ncbi:MAG: beta-lactamase family protein [Clostridiales bacterium]|nr:beta-lactamase family protein [Clostridiales bacterium]
MVKKLLLSFLTVSLFFRAPLTVAPGVENLVEEFRSQTKCGNVSVVVYDHGEITYYGDSDCLYQIGSMTKSFTGLAVQKLIDNGILSKDDTVSDLIPGFTAYYDSSEVQITVEDLLRQSSGFTNSENDYPSASEGMTLEEWAHSISGKELRSIPGTEYSYSNTNYNLLGLIIEKKTGMSYREFMEDAVLYPLGLDSTSAGIPENSDRIIEGTRLGFRSVFGYEVTVREGSVPAGYFYSDTEDIGKWMSAWIEGTDPDMEAVMANLKSEGDYYAGWERFGGDTTGHSGGTPNYSSRIVFSRSMGTGVCVLTNLNVASTTDSLCNSIFAELTGRDHDGLICDVWTVFDIIFTAVSVTGTVSLIVVLCLKKRGLLIGVLSIYAVLTALILILFPIIFGADIKTIALTWAPWSFFAGTVMMVINAVSAGIKLLVKSNEGRAKTG